ncbi:MAG: signal recognition particle subunit SRP19/SEC65 family protein [Candidatus Bathyarchaeota archaeon]|nr:signal recognition particle subunit SRP19/SEC65 family protein [Candidatus Bathyarchaeota archaeon]
MRKQDKTIIWPIYFDSSRTRKKGRRVSKNVAVKSPKINEIANVASKLGFQYEIIPEVSYPKKPWINTGLLLIEKKFTKEQLIKKIAMKLLKNRNNLSRKEKK